MGFKRMSIFKPAKSNDLFWQSLTSHSKEEQPQRLRPSLKKSPLTMSVTGSKEPMCTSGCCRWCVNVVSLNQRIAELPELDTLWSHLHGRWWPCIWRRTGLSERTTSPTQNRISWPNLSRKMMLSGALKRANIREKIKTASSEPLSVLRMVG